MSKEKYFNFPIQLLEGFMINSNKVIIDIKDYAVYENALKLEHGTELQKMKASASFYNMTLGSVKHTLDNGMLLYNSIPTNSPKVGMNLSIWWDFYNNEKTEFDKICLLAFLSIKSLIGAKPYYKGTTLYLWARMDGKIKSLEYKEQVCELSKEVRKYANRYQTTKIINELVLNWHLIYYSFHLRGFYLSFKLSLDELVFIAEEKRKSTKEKAQKNLIKEARLKALKRLNK